MSTDMASLANLSPEARRALLDRLSARARGERVGPLSYAQQRLWFLDRLSPGNPVYNECSGVRYRVAVDATALEAALNDLVERHGTLRTVFDEIYGEPRQRVLPRMRIRLERARVDGRSERAALDLAAADARRPFDLERGPLLRALLIELGPTDSLFSLTMHHLLCDGWSMPIVFEELGTAYLARVSGRAPEWPPLPMQYIDFALWQREWLSGPVMRQQLDYWRDQLAGLGELDLPTDFVRPASPSFAGGREPVRIEANVMDGLKRVADQEGATLFMAALTAYALMLHRWSGQNDIVVGSAIANRKRPELERLIGFFVNALALRVDFGGNPTFRTALRRVKETAIAAYANQDLPFERLVEELHPARHPGRNPIFQVTLQLINRGQFGITDATSEAPPVSARDPELATAKFDLRCDLFAGGQGLEGFLEYSADLFRAETVRVMARGLETLARGAAATPDQAVADLAVMTPEEERRVVVGWNATDRDFGVTGGVHEAFIRAAAAHGSRPAVIDGAHVVSYAELDRWSWRVCRALGSAGVSAGDVVGLLAHRASEYVAGLIGVLKSGAAYLPLDPSLPANRLESMIRAAGVRVALAADGISGIDGARMLAIPALGDGSDGDAPASVPVSARSLAYVIFTSGSSGSPKGVKVTHGGLLNMACWQREHFQITPEDRGTFYSSVGFDASVWELWMCLAWGAAVVIVDREVRASAEALARWILDAGVTVAYVPTALAEELVELHTPIHSRLRVLATAGERLRRHPSRPLPYRYCNLYGPTENTVVATGADVVAGASNQSPPIGKPIANVHAYVLDSRRRPAPPGVRGELYLGGAGVAAGYLGDEELTAQRFVPNPLPGRNGERLYRTGDLVRARADGVLEFHGRLDRQVKVRGHRVEPAEIEAVLAAHPAVRAAMVVPASETDGPPELVALVVPRGAGEGGADAKSHGELERSLRGHVRGALPPAMEPARFVVVERLPLTPSGKLDRRLMPALSNGRASHAHGAAQAEGEVSQPMRSVEGQIAAIWSKVLGVDALTADANFFDLGGHSLLLARVHSQLKDTFDTRLSLMDLFLYPSVRDLATAIEAERRAAPALKS